VIPREIVEQILDTAQIDEVIGQYVTLRRRGANLLGLCPFHNEKTPSFNVSVSKRIFKCFGCGKAGNVVDFVMEHEHVSFPEALRFLAKKYNIEIPEIEQTKEDLETQSQREALYHLTAFAAKTFHENLFETDEGKAIGLSYFRERGFSDETIKKFELGYCKDEWEDFTKTALKNGYKMEHLVASGLTIEKEAKHFDRFRGRVMFPIHNLSGRVIGFGGRILSSDKSKAKYINSPETEIYLKSKVLYGINQSRNTIVSEDNCYLVEGYTDVISLHQAGITNVVASSGTSLTNDQIKLISRFTKNVTILYDGDAAGIKASFRGIDMILEQGLNVRIVLFPDGEDPDSFARKNRTADVKEFIHKNAQNFILFKTGLLLEEAKHDPIKKTALIREIVNSIAIIPDRISRSVYVKECSQLLEVAEQTLINELNKIYREKHKKNLQNEDEANALPEAEKILPPQQEEPVFENQIEIHEREIIRLLLMHGQRITHQSYRDENNQEQFYEVAVATFIVHEILVDDLTFENKDYAIIFGEYQHALTNESIPDEQFFLHYEDEKIRQMCIHITSTPYSLSENWTKLHNILVPTEEEQHILDQLIISTILSFKLKKIELMTEENQRKLKEVQDEETLIQLLQEQLALIEIKKKISAQLGRIVTR